MAQDPWAAFKPQPAANSGPVLGPPPPPKAPPAPKTSYKTLSPEETAARGLPAGGVYQESSEGNLSTVVNAKEGGAGDSLDPKTLEGQKNISRGILVNSGVNLETGEDPVAELIKGSTSGKVQRMGADIYGGATGEATSGMENIGRLRAIGNDMVLQMTGGSLGTQISNADREFIAARMGDIANPDKPWNERLAAWSEVKRRMASISGINLPADDGAAAKAPPADGTPPPAGGGTRDVNMTGGVPTGSDIQFGMDKPEEAFDRSAYVLKEYGVNLDQENLILGFWNQNGGNAGLTVEGARAWYQKNNLPVPSDEGLATSVAEAKKGFQFGPFDTSKARDDYEAELNRYNQGRMDHTGAAARDPNSTAGYVDRAKTGLSLNWRDEISGVGGAIGGALTGENPVEAYKVTRDADRLLQQQERDKQGIPGYVAEFVGSIPTALVAPGARVSSLGGAVKSGATIGGLAGAGHGEGLAGTAKNALVGVVLGGGSGGALHGGLKGLGALGNSMAPRAIPNAGEVTAAGQREGVKVLTTDVMPPTTGVGKAVQRLTELTPVIGTGGTRSAQMAKRQDLVNRVIDEYGAGADAVDSVAKNLAKTRGKELDILTTAKDTVIDGIGKTVSPTQLRNTLRTIDTQVAKLNRANSDAFAPVVAKLENFRNTLASGKTLREVEMNRKLLGDMFQDPNLAAIKGDGQKALNAIYGPLREDMGAFIKTNGSPAQFTKWKAANDKLSAMAGELRSGAFKRVLNDAETTPEAVAGLIFNRNPSEVTRLVRNLGPKGQAKARAAVIYKVAQQATDNGAISPQKFANGMQAMETQLRVLFPAEESARLRGVVRLIKSTQRSVEAQASPSTGAQATPYMVAGAAATKPEFVIPTAVLMRIYESAPVRDLLLKLARVPDGSRAENAITQRILGSLTGGAGGVRTPANDVLSERMGGLLNQSAAAASSEGDKQNTGRKPIPQ